MCLVLEIKCSIQLYIYILYSIVDFNATDLISQITSKRQNLLFPFHNMEIGSDRFRKVKSPGRGHMARKWWSKGLNPDNLTQECRCLEALQRLIEGCEREGRGAEGCALVHCGKPLNSSTPHSPTKAYPTLSLSQRLALSFDLCAPSGSGCCVTVQG